MNRVLFQIILKICFIVALIWILLTNYGINIPVSIPQLSLPAVSLPIQQKEEPARKPKEDAIANTREVYFTSPLPNAGPLFDFKGKHRLYAELEDYQTDASEPFNIYYPFLNIGSRTNLTIHELSDQIILSAPLPLNEDDYDVNSPMTLEEIKFSTGETMQTEIRNTKTRVHNKSIFVSFKKDKLKVGENFPSTHLLKIKNTTYVIPFDEISQIKYVFKSSPPAKSIKKGCTKANKQNIYVYKVTASSCGDGTIILNRPYHKGWRAYEIKHQTLNIERLMHYFPFLFAAEIKEHVTVNSWSNGWNIDDEVTVSSNSNNSQIILIYYPYYQRQLLVVVFGVLIVVLILLIKLVSKKI